MSQKLEYTIMLFYSNFNEESLKTRVAMYEFIDKHRHRFKIRAKEVNYDIEKSLSQKYGVMGTPVLLFLKNGILIRRHFGEITPEEFKSFIEGISKL
jgi:thioredoxin-related protein